MSIMTETKLLDRKRRLVEFIGFRCSVCKGFQHKDAIKIGGPFTKHKVDCSDKEES